MTGLLLFGARDAGAVGAFIDVSRLSAFVRSAHVSSLDGSITRASAPGAQASTFYLASNFRVRKAFLLQIEFPFTTIGFDDGTEDGFGDVMLRVKTRLWKGSGRSLVLDTSARLGSGSATLFPFSSGSTDVELALAFVDSVGNRGGAGGLDPLRSFSYWVLVGASYPLRVDDTLENAGLYDRCAEAGGGIVAALARKIEIEAGGLGLLYAEGPIREIYFSRLTFSLTEASRISLVVQAEGGDEDDRAFDASVGIGLAVAY